MSKITNSIYGLLQNLILINSSGKLNVILF